MAFTFELVSAPNDMLVIEHEVFGYFEALELAEIPGASVLRRFDEFVDSRSVHARYPPTDAAVITDELRRLAEALNDTRTSVREPPERVGFDDDDVGVAFGREGFNGLLDRMTRLFSVAAATGDTVLARGD